MTFPRGWSDKMAKGPWISEANLQTYMARLRGSPRNMRFMTIHFIHGIGSSKQFMSLIIQYFYVVNIPGWWLTYPSEKYISQLGLLFPNIIYGKIKNVPNHQPDSDDLWQVLDNAVSEQRTWRIHSSGTWVKPLTMSWKHVVFIFKFQQVRECVR